MTAPRDEKVHAGRAWTVRAIAAADWLDSVLGTLCRGVIVFCGVALTVVMTANVVARYLLASGGFRWAQELPMLLFPLFVIAGIILAAQSNAHMAVEWLYGRFAAAGKARLFALCQLCAAASMLALAWHAAVVGNIAAAEHSPILGLPNSLGYYALSVGSVLIAVVIAMTALRVVLQGWEARPLPKTEEIPL